MELRDIELVGDSIVSGAAGESRLRIDRESIVGAEAREFSSARTVLLVGGIGLAVVGGLAIWVAALPSCDGGGC